MNLESKIPYLIIFRLKFEYPIFMLKTSFSYIHPFVQNKKNFGTKNALIGHYKAEI